MSDLLGNRLFTAFDSDGLPINGAELTFFLTGTSTPADVYHEAGLSTPWVQPIECDSAGRAPNIYLPATLLKMVITATDLNKTIDPCNALFTAEDIAFDLDASGSVPRPISSALRDREFVPQDFVTNGGTVTPTVLANFFSHLTGSGGEARMPPGVYETDEQLVVAPTDLVNVALSAYGAEIQTEGAISGLKVSGSATPHLFSIRGLKINHRGNADATFGIECVATAHLTLQDITVEAHGVDSDYAAVALLSSDPTSSDTGCFWTDIINLCVRKRQGADPGDIPRGVWLRGSSNATNIMGGSISLGTTGNGIEISNDTGQHFTANACHVFGTRVEGALNGVRVANANGTAAASGLALMMMRLESLTTFLNLDGTDTSAEVPPKTWGNYAAFTTNYIKNANGVLVENHDGFAGSSANRKRKIYSPDGHTLSSLQTQDVLIIDQATGGDGNGLGYTLNGGSVVASARWVSPDLIIRGNGVTDTTGVKLTNLRGISGAGANANNLRGTATFATAATKAVTFAAAEPDASYHIFLEGGIGETFFVTSKGTGGFTANSSNASSTATISWLLIR